jgi:pyridoxal phosphate enzyme (YggS family)
MSGKVSIKDNVKNVRERIARAAGAVGCDPQGIKLIAAVKTLPAKMVLEALEAGITDIGDNRVQEAAAKQDEIRAKFPQITWHMIGHLQRNKVRQSLDIFDIIQTIDSERLARTINERAQKKVSVLIEVNTSGEETKFGVPADQAIDLLRKITRFENLNIQGLMTIAPLVEDPETVRPCFKRLRALSEEIKGLDLPNCSMRYLSMGMTDDFEVAIQEGSNMVRIGRAIFGQRS